MNTLLRVVAAFAIKRSLRRTFSRVEIREIVSETGLEFDRQCQTSSPAKGLGGKLMERTAVLTVALYRVLLRHGLDAGRARATTARTTWVVYEKMALVPQALSFWKQDPKERLAQSIRIFRRFPFGPPDYDMVDVPAPSDMVAFDVRRCPVAEYFSAHGLSELCQESFCDLDYPLAERWGSTLERGGTLAGGASRCDFRWRIAPRSRTSVE